MVLFVTVLSIDIRRMEVCEDNCFLFMKLQSLCSKSAVNVNCETLWSLSNDENKDRENMWASVTIL